MCAIRIIVAIICILIPTYTIYGSAFIFQIFKSKVNFICITLRNPLQNEKHYNVQEFGQCFLLLGDILSNVTTLNYLLTAPVSALPLSVSMFAFGV